MKKRAKPRLLAATATIFLSLNAQVTDDSGRTFLTTIPLLPLPAWPAFWWWLASRLNGFLQLLPRLVKLTRSCQRSIRFRLGSLWETARLATTVLTIGLKSSLYGLGVDL